MQDERDLLEVLKSELEFLEKGGYDHSPRDPWRPQFIFEDSPTCMNSDPKGRSGPCRECVLMQLVPQAFREAQIPCRYIPFNAEGETLDLLYRYANQEETEGIFGDWLRSTVARLEEERRAHGGDSNRLPAATRVGAGEAESLLENLHPKCANPACPAAFHWLGGGKFFRFRPTSAAAQPTDQSAQPKTMHGVKHYWLCEHCSHIFTLVSDEKLGVLLKLICYQAPAEELQKQQTTAASPLQRRLPLSENVYD